MTICETNKIDAIGEDLTGAAVVLNLFDHLDWSDEGEHLRALQTKINAYLEFIQSGEIDEAYPAANGKARHIKIFARFELTPAATRFLDQARKVSGQLGIAIIHEIHSA